MRCASWVIASFFGNEAAGRTGGRRHFAGEGRPLRRAARFLRRAARFLRRAAPFLRRSGGGCGSAIRAAGSYVDRDSGRRCDSRYLLEIDHIVPYARGGVREC